MLLVLPIILLGVGPLAAQEPYLVADLNQDGRGSRPTPRVLFQDEVYLVLDTSERGYELWKTDGTEEGTQALKRFFRGGFFTGSDTFAAVGDLLFFTADDGLSGFELWRTDGTPEGTVMVKDIDPRVVGDFPVGSSPQNFLAYRGQLLFSANDGETGNELWISDGTEEGTELLADLAPGISGGAWRAQPVEASDGSIYFFGECDPLTPDTGRLCRFDGEPGSNPVAIGPPVASIAQMVAFDDGVIFTGDDDATGPELWRSDGTDEGTLLLRDIREGDRGSVPDDLTVVGAHVLFSASTLGSSDELWRTDGTREGTERMGGDCGECNLVKQIVASADRAFFTAFTPSSGTELWVSDTTDAGTRQVADIRPGTESSEVNQLVIDSTGRAFFAANDGGSGVELWSSDGTLDGTGIVFDIENSGSAPADLVPLADGGVVFGAYEATAGRELWRTLPDLSAARIIDLNPWNRSSDPSGLVKVGDRLFFNIEPSGGETELWLSDGSEAGTQKIDRDGNPFGLDFVDYEGLTYFAYDREGSWSELWRSDGTKSGTERIDLCPGECSTLPRRLTPADGLLYFVGVEEGFGAELWRFDDTPEGTGRISDLCEGVCSPVIQSLTTIGGQAFFTAEGRLDGVSTGREVFTSDGTPSGTRLVVDLVPGFDSADPQQLTPIGDRIVFSAETAGFLDDELWVTDGTAEGTTLIGPFVNGTIRDVRTFGDRALFIEGFSDLWITDGTESGTTQIPGPSGASDLVVVGDRAFFMAELEGAGFELWVTDGTVEGTNVPLDIFPGEGSSLPRRLTAFGNRIVFSAISDDASGRELWISDGTPEGTTLVADVPDANGDPEWLTPVEDTLFYTLYTLPVGRELWAYTPPPSLQVSGSCPGGVSLSAAALAPGTVFDLYAGIPLETSTLKEGACSGRTVDLGAASWLATVRADNAGAFQLDRVISSESCDLSVQLVDRSDCRRSRPQPLP